MKFLKCLINFFSVPEKVYNIQNPEKINPAALDLNRPLNEDELWWNQCNLKNLDLSSNVIVEVSSDIKNLLDLTVLNVSFFLLLKIQP